MFSAATQTVHKEVKAVFF